MYIQKLCRRVAQPQQPALFCRKPWKRGSSYPYSRPICRCRNFAGATESLSAHRGKAVLLHFCSATLADFQEYQRQLERSYGDWGSKGLQVLTINTDSANAGKADVQIPSGRYSFPVLKGSSDVLAVYNLLFRQLFDRHRDMSVPLSFLIDAAGNIVKIYQGAISPDKIGSDFRAIPKNDSERLARALPFPGLKETYEYERNYLSFGFVYYERGYFEQAQQFFAQALKDDPRSAEALYGLGSAYLQQQKTTEARDCFQRALQLHATYPGTLPNCWNNLRDSGSSGRQF